MKTKLFAVLVLAALTMQVAAAFAQLQLQSPIQIHNGTIGVQPPVKLPGDPKVEVKVPEVKVDPPKIQSPIQDGKVQSPIEVPVTVTSPSASAQVPIPFAPGKNLQVEEAPQFPLLTPADLTNPGTIATKLIKTGPFGDVAVSVKDFGKNCNPSAVIARLSTEPQSTLGEGDKFVAALTTPFKRMGVSGWEDTGCIAHVVAVPVRTAQHSTDGFYTIDTKLVSMVINGVYAPLQSPRFIRIEVEPGGKAHSFCDHHLRTPSDHLTISGPVLIDRDGPFLEIHPIDDLHVN